MKKKTIIVWLVLILALSWALPIYGVVYNQINPNYASALGVAYGFAIGCAVGFVGSFLWLLIRRSKRQKVEIAVLLASFSLLTVLAIVSNGGSLSRVTG